MCRHHDTCPLCGGGKLEMKVVEERFGYKGHTLVVPDYRILECPICGEALVAKESACRAERLLREFWCQHGRGRGGRENQRNN